MILQNSPQKYTIQVLVMYKTHVRTALNIIISLSGFSDTSEYPLIKRFIKGVFNTKPPQTRYKYIKDYYTYQTLDAMKRYLMKLYLRC